MPKTPFPAAGEAVHAYTIDDIILDTNMLRHLLDVTTNVLCGMDFGKPDGGRNYDLDRVAALVHVAAANLTQIANSIEANYGQLIEGEGRSR